MDPDLPLSLPPGARFVLRAPDLIARTLAVANGDPLNRWILRRSRAVRRSFVEQVIEPGGHREQRERWMLLQDDDLRGSYVKDVLLTQDEPDREAIWLLGQGRAVRESYVTEVLGDE